MIVWIIVLVIVLILILGILLYFFFKDRKVITGGIFKSSVPNTTLENTIKLLNRQKIPTSIIKNIVTTSLDDVKGFMNNVDKVRSIGYINSIYIGIFLQIINTYETPKYVPVDITKIIV